MNVSVIIPIYNVSRFIECCAESLMQTMNAIWPVRHNFDETIAFIEAKGVCDEVDDDSTDSSLQVLNEFASIKR